MYRKKSGVEIFLSLIKSILIKGEGEEWGLGLGYPVSSYIYCLHFLFRFVITDRIQIARLGYTLHSFRNV